METQEEMSRYFWSASTNCLPVATNQITFRFGFRRASGNAVSAVRPWDRGWATHKGGKGGYFVIFFSFSCIYLFKIE
jgi:hypothetical protein